MNRRRVADEIPLANSRHIVRRCTLELSFLAHVSLSRVGRGLSQKLAQVAGGGVVRTSVFIATTFCELVNLITHTSRCRHSFDPC
jgi:hypothetical protein